MFLEKPNNQKINQKQYYEKHYDTITQKIEELGGMEDTLSRMEDTLKSNEISNVKNKSILKEPPMSPKSRLFSQTKSAINPSEITNERSWVERSKQLRQKFQ